MAEELNDKRHRALLDSVVKARADFESLQDDAEAAKLSYYDAVRALHESGMPLREIAEHLGLSHQRVHQILGMETAKKKKRSGKAMGAAGIVLAIVLSTISIFATRDEPLPPRPERVELVNQPPISMNDVRAAMKYERPLASGTMDGSRWSLLTTTLNGIYCVRMEFTPGGKQQGSYCSYIPTIDDSEDIRQTNLIPSDVKPWRSPRPLAYGIVSSRTHSVLIETCEGFRKEVGTISFPQARIDLFVAELDDPATGASIELRDIRGRTFDDTGPPSCATTEPPDNNRKVIPPERVGPTVEVASGLVDGTEWRLHAYRAVMDETFDQRRALCLSFVVGGGRNFNCFVGSESGEARDSLQVISYGAGKRQALVGRVAFGVERVEFRSLNDETTALEVYPAPAELDLKLDFFVGFVGRDDSGTVVALDPDGRVLTERRVCCPLR